MKLEIEMTKGQLDLLILSTELYVRALMNQPDLVADILAEDRFFYDKNDPDNSRQFDQWMKDRNSMTEYLKVALNMMFQGNYKSETCQNLIDIWHVLRHLQYILQDDSNKINYDVRSSEPFQMGSEPLMRIRLDNKQEDVK
jgi:hypothetical protein